MRGFRLNLSGYLCQYNHTKMFSTFQRRTTAKKEIKSELEVLTYAN